MTRGPKITMLPDGRRLHLQHGPTDLIIEASGDRDEVAAAYRQAIERFRTILLELVGELSKLKGQCAPSEPDSDLRWTTAQRMLRAVRPHAEEFVTPMAAVAGAVADEILAAMLEGRKLSRAYVNNGGDIALHLEEGERYVAGLVARPERPEPAGTCTVTHDMPIRGIATSGRGGRSFSLGIADAVTVLAKDAASADVAATLVGNAVDADHPAIDRVPAETLDPDSDLGNLMVTTAVGPLDDATVMAALARGVARAERMMASGLIHGAALCLEEQYRVVGPGMTLTQPDGKEKWSISRSGNTKRS